MDWQAESKVGSMDQIKHQAGGGDKEVLMGQIPDHPLPHQPTIGKISLETVQVGY